MAKGSSRTYRGRYMMECGAMTRRMAMARIFIQMGLCIREVGRKISRMVSELNSGQIHQSSQVSIKMAEKMAGEGMCGPTEPSTRDSGRRMR